MNFKTVAIANCATNESRTSRDRQGAVSLHRSLTVAARQRSCIGNAAVAQLLAILLLGDRFSVLQAVGGALVLMAVIVVQAAHLWRPGPPLALR